MTLYCAGCRRLCPADEFRNKRMTDYKLWTGHRVRFLLHFRCKVTTIMLDSGVAMRGKMAAEVLV